MSNFLIKHFNKIKTNAKNTYIIKCKICGDLLYYSDILDKSDFNWFEIENTDWHVCSTCCSSYITETQAKRLDMINETFFGSAIDAEINRPYRSNFTWNEHQQYNKEYKNALKEFLLENDLECYNKYKELFDEKEENS